jgi:hypothetical protein
LRKDDYKFVKRPSVLDWEVNDDRFACVFSINKIILSKFKPLSTTAASAWGVACKRKNEFPKFKNLEMPPHHIIT